MPIAFNYPPLRGAKKIIKWQVTDVGFGSGYSFAAALGRDVRWQVGFVVECLEDLHSLVNVFVEAKGVDTLLWTPPSHSQSEFVLNDWKVTPLRNDAYRVDVDLKLIEVITLDGNQSGDPYYVTHSKAIEVLNLAAQFGSTQTTRVRNISLQYANQYQQRNYDDTLRSIFETWDVQANGLILSAATELDVFLDARRGEKPFKWDDGVCDVGGGGGNTGGIAADGTGVGGHADHFYKCKEWEFEYLVGDVEGVEECLNGVVNFRATFEQCYGIYLKESTVTYGWIMGYWTMAISNHDATSWQQIPGQTPEFTDPFDESGCYCLMKNEQGLIVAVGENNKLFRQLDPEYSSGGLINAAVSYDGGRNWVNCTQLIPYSERGSYSEGGAYGNGVFVIAGDWGHLWTSDDGLNWQDRHGRGIKPLDYTLPHNNLTNDHTGYDYHTCAAFGNNTFMAGTDTGIIRRSTDNGVTWQTIWICDPYLQRLQGNYVANSYRVKSFAYGSGRWIAIVGWNQWHATGYPTDIPLNLVLSSTDNGDTWQDIHASVPVTAYQDYFGGEVRFIQNKFYFAGDEGKIAISLDGINWILIPNNPLDIAVTPILPEYLGSPAYTYTGVITALAYNSSQNAILFARGDGVLATYNLNSLSWTLITSYESGLGYSDRFFDSPLFLLEANAVVPDA